MRDGPQGPSNMNGIGRREPVRTKRPQHDVEQPVPNPRQRGIVQRIKRRNGVTRGMLVHVGAVRMHERHDGVITTAPENRPSEALGHVLDHPRTEQRAQLPKPGNMLVERGRRHPGPLRDSGKGERLTPTLINHGKSGLHHRGGGKPSPRHNGYHA